MGSGCSTEVPAERAREHFVTLETRIERDIQHRSSLETRRAAARSRRSLNVYRFGVSPTIARNAR